MFVLLFSLSLSLSQFIDENENDFSKSNEGNSLKSFGKAWLSATSEAPSETAGGQTSLNVSDSEQDGIAGGSGSK